MNDLNHDRVARAETVIKKLLEDAPDLGTKDALDVAFQSLEKQRGAKVNQTGYVGNCPKCETFLVYGTRYCKQCGQKIYGWIS